MAGGREGGVWRLRNSGLAIRAESWRRKHAERELEVWFQDEARIGQKNTLTPDWCRPAAAKEVGSISAKKWLGLPGGGQSGRGHLLNLQYHRDEPPSAPRSAAKLGAAAHAWLVLTPAPAEAGGAGLERQPGAGDTRQHYLVGVTRCWTTHKAGSGSSASGKIRAYCCSPTGSFALWPTSRTPATGRGTARCLPRLDPFPVGRRLGARLDPGSAL